MLSKQKHVDDSYHTVTNQTEILLKVALYKHTVFS
jgi:hypothetical protein